MSNSVEGGRYLLSILDKGVASLTSAELDIIVAREVDAVQSNNNTSLAAILYQPPEYFVFGLAIILLLFFTAVMPAVRTHNQHKLKKEVAQATRDLESKTQELSSELQAAAKPNTAEPDLKRHQIHTLWRYWVSIMVTQKPSRST